MVSEGLFIYLDVITSSVCTIVDRTCYSFFYARKGSPNFCGWKLGEMHHVKISNQNSTLAGKNMWGPASQHGVYVKVHTIVHKDIYHFHEPSRLFDRLAHWLQNRYLETPNSQIPAGWCFYTHHLFGHLKSLKFGLGKYFCILCVSQDKLWLFS
jgi:hypothetical protein